MGDEMNEIWIESDTRYRSYYTEDGMAVNRIRYIRADLVPISCGGTLEENNATTMPKEAQSVAMRKA
jgi:hypothetical protein